MKKLLMMLMFSFALIAAKAQTEVKVKPTTTPIQKVHNMTHRNKHHKGYKVKEVDADGEKTKTIVNNRKGKVEVKHN